MKHSFGNDYNFYDFPYKIQNIISDEIDLEKRLAKKKSIIIKFICNFHLFKYKNTIIYY